LRRSPEGAAPRSRPAGRPTPPVPRGLCVFGPFKLDPARGTLVRDGVETRLRPKSVQVLRYLLENQGRVIPREELIDAVWQDTAVTEDSLTQCLIEVRRAVGDQARKIIRTLPRRGCVLEVPATMEDEARRSSRSIAVMAFDDMSAEHDKECLAEGISDEILNLLARMRGLRVIARSCSFVYKGRGLDVGTVGRRLGVRYVLEGSVRQFGRKIRVTAQLVEAASCSVVWSATRDSEQVDTLALQREMATAVGRALSADGGPTTRP
jgi:TolB-like protein